MLNLVKLILNVCVLLSFVFLKRLKKFKHHLLVSHFKALVKSTAKKMATSSGDYFDNKLRFANNLMSEIITIRGEDTRWKSYMRSSFLVYLFTEEHASVLRTHLITNGTAQELDNLISERTTEYSIDQLRNLMEILKNEFNKSAYNDDHSRARGLICALGNIAYVGAHFKKENKQTRHIAVEYIREWILNEPEDSILFTYRQEPERD